MNRVLSGFLAISLGCILSHSVQAAQVTHDWTGTGPNGNMSIDVDDQGGGFNNGGNDESYDLHIDGTGVTSTLTLYLFNGSVVDDGSDDTDNGDSQPVTGDDFVNGSGLTILEPPSVLTPPVTEIGALSDNPLTPFSFQGSQTGLDVKQLTYVQNDKNFVIFEYTITNNTGSDVPVKIGLGGDFDIADTNSDDLDGKDLSVPMVFMHDTSANANGQYYAPGLAVAGGTFDNYRLGNCCDTTYVNVATSVTDINRLHYFNARPNEECDDGNNINGDGCSADCKTETGAETCGNGVIEAGEGCDDSNTTGGDGCSDVCLSENCGNSTLDPGEECDDGNLNEDDGCSSYCTYEFNDSDDYCGDGTSNDGGTGDQESVVGDNEVTISIDLGTLADGQSGVGAFCITGGFSDVDGPTAAAATVTLANECLTLYQTTIAVCGNGIQNAGEECDDGNIVDGDGCDATCQQEANCGNGVVDAGEQCDDGNTNNNDGCTNACTGGFQFQGSGCSLARGGASSLPTWLGLLPLLGAAYLGLRRRLS